MLIQYLNNSEKTFSAKAVKLLSVKHFIRHPPSHCFPLG